jgi:hypothetical protein
MDNEAPALTLTDKLSLTGFGVFICLCMTAGALSAIYIQMTYRGGDASTGPGQWEQVALYLFGMFGGTAVGLLLTRLISHCFVPLETQKRWLGPLEDALENPYVQYRGPGLVRLFMWAAVPDRDAL